MCTHVLVAKARICIQLQVSQSLNVFNVVDVLYNDILTSAKQSRTENSWSHSLKFDIIRADTDIWKHSFFRELFVIGMVCLKILFLHLP